jgi:hypothetical protein
MNLLHEYIRAKLVEDLAMRQGVTKDLEASEDWPQTASKHRRSTFSADDRYQKGRILKKAFHKHADRSFLDTITTVHWADHPGMLATLLKVSHRDEVSTSAYLPGELKSTGTGGYGAYGLEIKGHISLLANNMDDVITGGITDFEEDNDVESHRSKSSGKNKGVKKTYIPSAYSTDVNSILVLDKSDWNPVGADDGVYNNEALVDNWRPVAIIVSNEESYEDSDMEELEKYADEFNLEIKRTKGTY